MPKGIYDRSKAANNNKTAARNKPAAKKMTRSTQAATKKSTAAAKNKVGRPAAVKAKATGTRKKATAGKKSQSGQRQNRQAAKSNFIEFDAFDNAMRMFADKADKIIYQLGEIADALGSEPETNEVKAQAETENTDESESPAIS